MSEDLDDFVLATKALFSPRPLTVEESNVRLRSYGFKVIPRELVPDYNLQGFETLAYFEADDTVLVHWVGGRA